MNNSRIFWPRAIAGAVVAVGALSALPDVGHADLIVNSTGYCSAGANSSNTADTVPGSLLSVNDVNLVMLSSSPSYHPASNCYGAFDPGNSSPANETGALNDIFGPGFQYLDKTGGASDPVGLGGITFQVHTLGGSDGAPGLWSLTWTDLGLSTLENLPLTVDLAVLLVGGNYSAAYLLSNVLIPTGPAFGIGTFDIQFFNGSAQSNKCNGPSSNKYSVSYGSRYEDKHGSKSDNKHGHNYFNQYDKECKQRQPTISHLLLAGRIVPTTIEVPEPTTMTMFGAGLLGLWVFRRKRSR